MGADDACSTTIRGYRSLRDGGVHSRRVPLAPTDELPRSTLLGAHFVLGNEGQRESRG